MLDIYLPIPEMHVEGFSLITLGLAVGFISGFFGVGGGIIAVPMLHIMFDVPYPVAIGSSLALIIGTCVSASYRHHYLGNISYRMGFIFVIGTFVGVELGARLIEILKDMGELSVAGNAIKTSDFVISVIYACLLSFVGMLMFYESRETARNNESLRDSKLMKSLFLELVHSFRLRPQVRVSGAEGVVVSFWMIFFLSIVVGTVTGLLGVGGGFILVPAMIYIMKMQTRIAVGTSLFCIIFGSLYGTFTHTVKGNVDIVLVLVLLLGSTAGAQLGAIATRRFKGPQMRFYFSIMTFFAAGLSAAKLLWEIFPR